MTTDLLDGGRPRRLILRKGRWFLEMARLVSTGDGVFRPHSHRIEGRAAILEALRRSKAGSLVESTARLVESGGSGDATFDAVEGAWIPSGLAPSYVKQLGHADVRTPAEAALVAELTLLRASHEGLLARVARLERRMFGEGDAGRPGVVSAPESESESESESGDGSGSGCEDGSGSGCEDGSGDGFAFPPVTILTLRLTDVCGRDVPIKEMKSGSAVWVDAPGRFQASLLVDDAMEIAGAILFDTPGIARLGGALLALGQGEVDAMATAAEPNPDVVAAASELCTHLCGPICDVPGNPHVRAEGLAPLADPLPDWLVAPRSFVVCAHPGGGTVAFVAK